MAYKHPRAQRRSKRCTGGVPQIGILQHSIFPAAVCIHVSSFQHIKILQNIFANLQTTSLLMKSFHKTCVERHKKRTTTEVHSLGLFVSESSKCCGLFAVAAPTPQLGTPGPSHPNCEHPTIFQVEKNPTQKIGKTDLCGQHLGR